MPPYAPVLYHGGNNYIQKAAKKPVNQLTERLYKEFMEVKKVNKKILVDWLTCTLGINCFMRDFVRLGEKDFRNKDPLDTALDASHFTDEAVLSHVIHFLGLPSDTKLMPGKAHYGYGKWYFYSGIRLAWGNCDTIMIDMTGEGCRLFETLVPDLDWLTFIKKVTKMQVHNFSRLDVACDTQGKGGLRMRDILRFTLDGHYVSRWKLPPRIVQGREETVDFGSPKSRTMLRIYNKSLERECKLTDDISIPENWVRCELQLRNDAVDSFIREWMKSGDISACYFGIMANQLRFVKERKENASRSEIVKWWRDFWIMPSLSD